MALPWLCPVHPKCLGFSLFQVKALVTGQGRGWDQPPHVPHMQRLSGWLGESSGPQVPELSVQDNQVASTHPPP